MNDRKDDVFGEVFGGNPRVAADEYDFAEMGDEELYAVCRTYSPSPKSKANGRPRVANPNHKPRATKSQMAARTEALRRIVEEVAPCSVRQVFYQATVAGFIDKTEAGYDIVQRALVDMRRDGVIDYEVITDSTRWQIKPDSFNRMEDALAETARLYRRDLWYDTDAYVEVWLEKDALSGVVHPVTSEYDVPLMVARGFASLTFLHASSRTIKRAHRAGKRIAIFHLGDRDPSGVLAGQKIEQTLREFAPEVDITFRRLAVTPKQIKTWKLPSRPTKVSSHAAGWKGDSVELDAIHPEKLRKLLRVEIEALLPPHALEIAKVAEAEERKLLRVLGNHGRDFAERMAKYDTEGEL